MTYIGDPVSTGFTLSRVWKKKKSKSPSNGDHGNGAGAGGGVEDGVPMTQLIDQHSKTVEASA